MRARIPLNKSSLLFRDFKALQQQVRKRLAKQRKAKVDAIEWPIGTLHDLRRTWCTRVAAAVPMHVLKELAGHASISTTVRFYLAASTSDAEKVRTALYRAYRPSLGDLDGGADP